MTINPAYRLHEAEYTFNKVGVAGAGRVRDVQDGATMPVWSKPSRRSFRPQEPGQLPFGKAPESLPRLRSSSDATIRAKAGFGSTM